MSPKPDSTKMLALVALCVIGIIILSALHTAVPSILELIAVGALGGGGALSLPAALPNTNTTTTTTQTVDPRPVLAVQVPVSTGTFPAAAAAGVDPGA